MKYKPYRVPKAQMLKAADPELRVNACQALLELINNDRNILNNILMTDESIFSLDNCLSGQQLRIWSPTKPTTVQQSPLQPARITVWCGMTSEFVVGPYFIEGTIDAPTYLKMLKEQLLPDLRRRRVMRKIYFQQDGAPGHSAAASLGWLRETFRNRYNVMKCRGSNIGFLETFKYHKTCQSVVHKTDII